MDKEQIINKMNFYLYTATTILVDWLGKYLPATSKDWWEDCVMGSLTYNQREIASEKGFSELSQFDLAALLRIADKSWYALRTILFLPTKERETIRDMKRVRNNWAHVGATLPGKDAIVADLETLHDFFEQRGCDDEFLNDIDRTMQEVRSSSIDFVSFIEAVPTNQSENEESVNAAESDIEEKSIVYLTGDPDTHGIVMSITDLGETKKYDIFVNGVFKTFYSGQIALYMEEQANNWINNDQFRSYLTAYQINNPSRGDLYSLNAARIDFVPYQFRPALKLIHADEPRMLIADSVGVGKTIEAGLIIKELEARNELENIMVICPKPLVTERKWEMEMQRFDEEFVPVDGPILRQIISDTDRDGEWPIRYSKTIVPYSILDSRTYQGETNKKRHSYGLIDLDPAPHFDIVIVDEAHHIRNGSMEKEKAFEYKCVKYFCDNADAVVMLTATPLQTSDDDLFTLLNLLRPDVIIDKDTFQEMSKPNGYVSRAAKIIRKADKDWKQDALKSLEGVLETQWGENVIAANPTYAKMINTLQQEKVTREERVELISEAESLHSFNSMLNRTRRKDIEDFCIRRTYTLAVDFTAAQKELHDELLRFEQEALVKVHGSVRSIPFMMSMIKRQAASCIFGLAPYIRGLIDRRFDQIEDELDLDPDEVKLDEMSLKELKELSQKLLVMADSLPEEDPKFDCMLEVIQEKQKQKNNKVIIFSTFRYTLGYLRRKLQENGLRVAQVDGSVKDSVRLDLRERFEKSRNEDDAIDIMLFSEVGSEGLDYEFCDIMINYDLPWNPMRIEQRIGRIDRRGQKSESVSIYNIVTNDTVDADIYYRCLMRIGVFESNVGECDEILGDVATQIDQIAMDPELTDDERKIKLEQMADNEVRRMQEMDLLEEEEKEFFGFDISEYMTSQEIHRSENPWLSPKNLQIMIEQYLTQRLGAGNYIYGERELKHIRLPVNARMELREDLRKLPGERNALRRTWDAYLKGNKPNHSITFDPETADKERNTFFITPMHPLAKQAAAYFATNELAYIRLRYVTEDIPKGTYRFSVYAWSYMGIYPHFRLVVVCDDDGIAAELSDILQDSQNVEDPIPIEPADWDDLELKQVKLWKEAKAAEIQEANNTAAFKRESLSNNFYNQKRSLEQSIQDTLSEKIRIMYMSQLESATERYEQKIAELKKEVEQTDIHTTLIANGILDVING